MTVTRVELLLGGQQVDIAEAGHVRYTEGAGIRRGRLDEQTTVDASRCGLTIDNATGAYTPRNPLGTHYGKIGRNTPLRVVLPIVEDTFARTVSNGWGSADTGEAWSTNGGAASDYSVGSGVGSLSMTAVSSARETFLASVSEQDVVVSAKFKAGVVATGGPIDMAVVGRRLDADNHYAGYVRFNTDSTVQVLIVERLAGTNFVIGIGDDTFTYGASTEVVVEFAVVGSYLAVRAYDAANPATTSISTSVNDQTHARAGAIGVRTVLSSANTNTLPVAVTVDNFRLDDVRFTGEVPSWPVVWDETAVDVQARIEAAGILRRLSQGAKNLQSCHRRYILAGGPTNVSQEDPIDFWSLEDAAGSKQAINDIGSTPGQVIGDFKFAAAAGPAGSDSLPSIAATGVPTALVRFFPSDHVFDANGDLWKVMFWFRGTGTNASCAPLVVSMKGDLPTWRVTVENSGTATVQANVHDRKNVIQATATVNVDVLDGAWHLITMWAFRSGSNAQVHLRVDGDSATDDFATATGFTGGRLNWLQTPSAVAMSNIEEAQVGALQLYNDNNISELYELATMDAMGGLVGETAAARMVRLCREESLPLALYGDAADTEVMGPQRIATLLQLINDCADTDMGLLYEPRQFFGLAYRTRASLYNQSATLGLDYAAGHFDDVPEPVEDDQRIRNDVIVTRRNGSSARHTVTDGPLSTQDPPDGVGVYEYPVTLDPASDQRLPDLAGWIAHLGTVDEPRYPSLRTSLHVSTSLVPAARRVDIGHLITADHLPTAFLPPDTIRALVQGSTEELREDVGVDRWITWRTSPASPYTIGVLDTVGSQLYAAATSTATTWDVATTGTSTVTGKPAPRWTTSASDRPFDLAAAGERVTVTNVANGTWTFVAAGTAASNGNAAGNATLAPGLPAGLAQGHLLLVKASIRNSGAGVPNTPAGYVRLPIYDSDANVQIFGKVAGASESAPTISFTGGVANADIIAQTAAWSSSIGINNISNLVMYAAQRLGVTGQNIAYPKCPVPEDNCLILWSGWKQDDWTSVATIASAAEIGEPSSIAGDDAGMVWDYLIQTAKADIAAGSFTVTGGASAISRAAVAALRVDVQRMTVTRSVNGVVKSQSAGEAIKLWTPAVIGL